MKYVWTRKIDIETIDEIIKRFCKSKNFQVKEYQIERLKRIYMIKGKKKTDQTIHLKIQLYEDDEGIILETNSAKNTTFALFTSYLMQFMGAGIFLKKTIELSNFQRKIEEELVKEIEKTLLR